MRRYCIEGCGRETSAYSKTGKIRGGKRNELWCPTCDEARIQRISAQLGKVKEALSPPRDGQEEKK